MADITNAQHLTLTPGQSLVGLLVVEDGREVERYFVSSADQTAEAIPPAVQAVLDLAGAWEDLDDWAEAEAALDRIRHDSHPTPPITDP